MYNFPLSYPGTIVVSISMWVLNRLFIQTSLYKCRCITFSFNIFPYIIKQYYIHNNNSMTQTTYVKVLVCSFNIKRICMWVTFMPFR